MSKPKTDLDLQIMENTLGLLLKKESEEISVRDIADACGVTATSIYYYYKDKEDLFTEIKMRCIKELDKHILEQSAKKINKLRKSGKNPEILDEIRIGLEIFRDWSFANPRKAILIMGRLKADKKDDREKEEKYYQTYYLAKGLLDRMIEAGLYESEDTLLDASLLISAIWGAIELTLFNRTLPKYWTKRGGVEFTDKMINFLLTSLTRKKTT